MTISFGSGQTNGLPLLITAITQGTRQLLHTFPVGSATPNVVRLMAWNFTSAPAVLNVAIEDSGATLLRLLTLSIPVGGGLFDILSADNGTGDVALVQNGASTIKVYSDIASALGVSCSVNDQSSTSGPVSQNVASGLVAAVQNANRFAVSAQGGTGQATEANANIQMARAGTLRNLRAVMDATIGGGATVTVSVRKNGVTTALSLAFTAANTTVAQTDTDSVTFVAGDLITFLVNTDNAGAPAANVQASVELV